MRIALILLSIVALMFISSISWSLMKNEGGWIPTRTSENTPIQGTDIESLRAQIKTEEKLKELEQKYEELAKKTGISTTAPVSNSSGSTEVINLSGKFLAQVMPTATLTLIESNGIFGLYTFDQSTTYSTYEDTKMGMKVIATTMDYDTFIRNARALGKEVYTVNETKTFPSRSFYLNPPKTDTLVRLVLEYESQTVAIEIPKSKFTTLKTLLLKK